MEYRKLECGIVIRLNDDGTTDWPYGPRQSARIDGAPSTETEFLMQQEQVWLSINNLLQLNSIKHVLEDLEPDFYDVAFAAIGYAILTYDARRGASLRTHAWRMAKYAIAAMRAKQQAATCQLSEHQGAENFIGQIEANVDIYRYKAELSREQWSLLLARFDSYLSYDEIAREFGFASRTTAMNKIEQALAACRRLLQ